MRKLPFKPSSEVTIGIELEYQIVDPMTYDLIARAKDLIRNIKGSSFQKYIKPEVTQSMIEVNSGIHQSPAGLYQELLEIRDFLQHEGKKIGVLFAGGGTHPFQKWSLRKIFPSQRFKKLSRQYRYLSKQSTVFGQHIHIGCKSAEDALYLTHALGRYVPQLIAINASSPFYENEDTGFHSSRLNIFTSFPSSGVIPYLTDWQSFSNYFYKMRKLGILETMKDVYWDVRPKPEFGTVEVRVCDTPLTLHSAVVIAAYLQTLSLYLLEERPFDITPDIYCLYGYNHFQACRYGFEGNFVNPITSEQNLISDDILQTLVNIEKYSKKLNNREWLNVLKSKVKRNQDDAILLRETFKKTASLPQVVRKQCLLWANDGKKKYGK
jgi:carboxylate-amine ligase